MSLWSFQGAREASPLYEKNRLRLKGISRARSLKTQQRTENNIEVDVILGELNSRTTPAAVKPAEPIKRVQRLPE
jgi:hypothetical protein